MSMTDPISDMLTRIRNAQTARKPSVTLPASKQKLAVAKVLEQEGYIGSVTSDDADGKPTLTLELKYYQDQPVIERIERVSRPGLRIFRSADDLPVVQGGLGSLELRQGSRCQQRFQNANRPQRHFQLSRLGRLGQG